MQYLDLSGVALAERVTALREDEKRTAPETISRWLNGANPVDPFLMGWITELVRSKVNKNIKPMVELPKNGLIIAVVNPKGGTGVTSLCMNLAATAKSLQVPLLRQAKSCRQLILATHDANLPVNADAEFVFALESVNGRGGVLAQGGLDRRETALAVLDIMEGSEEAFRRRFDKYHF